MEKITLSIKNWIKKNPIEFWILLSILIIGAFMRLYKIDGYMTFLGDEGRDVIIVRRLLTEAHPPLIGPGTSIGNMYLGPFYYYMMAPALLIAGFSPIGPAIQIALLGIFTVWFVWYIGRTWFDKTVGLVAASLYAISPTIVTYSHSSWNPNIMPFFSLLSVYSVWKVWKHQDYKWLVVLGFAFSGVIQSHYLGLLLVPTLGIFWLLSFWKVWKTKLQKTFVNKSLIGFGIFVILLSPLFFFDVRHNWMNTRAMYTFFTVRQTTVSIRPWTAIPKIPETLKIINTSLVGGKTLLAGEITSAIVGIIALFVLWKTFKDRKFLSINSELLMLITWFGFALIGFGIYKQNIYDHYYGFVFSVPYLLIGIFVSFLFKYKLLGKVVGSTLLVYLVVVNLMQNPLKSQPGYQLDRASNVAEKIKVESHGSKFNLGVIAERNYEDGYKYFLLKDNQPVVSIDSQVKDSITDQLFVVCELEKSKCDPTHNASAAVANFGWSKIDNSWEVDGVLLYRLIHSQK